MRADLQPVRTVSFIDGQNLYRHAKTAFGHNHRNYDPIKLAEPNGDGSKPPKLKSTWQTQQKQDGKHRIPISPWLSRHYLPALSYADCVDGGTQFTSAKVATHREERIKHLWDIRPTPSLESLEIASDQSIT